MLAATTTHASPAGLIEEADLAQMLKEKCAPYLAEIAATSKPPPPLPGQQAPDRPALAKELHAMAVLDQEVRGRWIGRESDSDALADMRRVDAANLVKLRHIFVQDEFPTRAMVGSEGVQDAWLLVQHAVADHELQVRVLAQLKTRLRAGEVRAPEYALLTDRVLRQEGKPQIYGTQFDENFKMEPTRDIAHLDERRRAAGLPSIAAYGCLLHALYKK